MRSTSLKAALIHTFKGIEQIFIEDIATPTPKPFQVQIKVHYAGINPVDWKIAEGLLKARLEYHFPIIPGWDLSGTVSAVGSEVTHLKEGDAVFAFCFDGELIHQGTYAEYVCFDARHVMPKPKSISFAEAAALPLISLTAWQAIHEQMDINRGDKILVQAGAGGVGSMAIQFAKLKGAHVISTTSAKNFEYVADFGADELIDYTKAPFDKQLLEMHPEKIDHLFDTVGNMALPHSYHVLKQGGTLVSIAGTVDPNIAKKHNIEVKWFMLHADGEQLKEIAQLIDASKIQVPDVEEVAFDNFEQALHRSREGHVKGKLVLKVI